ncbi:MAG: M20/M25/M40 family metallo-hydrolase [Anaerolineae bacterium]|nr:M20/M25/M40 family metallo-hydrolase [Anaerolineae bacterium]
MKKSLAERVLERALLIQQIPAPTYEEGERAAYVRSEFELEGLSDITQDEIGNVYARIPGGNSEKCVVVSAHLDTVFPRDTDLKVKAAKEKIRAPGLGDNSIGLAGLFGLLWGIREEKISLAGDIWLVANVGEEGLGDLRGMRAVVDRFEAVPAAYIVLEGFGLGRVFVRGLGVRRFRIHARTQGGHSWANYGMPSAIHEIAKLITELAKIKLPADPKTTLNVGMICGGTSVNSIAANASIEVDLRSEDQKALEQLVGKVLKLVNSKQHKDLAYEVEPIGSRPYGEISESHPLVQTAKKVLGQLGLVPELIIGSTDANIPLNLGFPAICIGITTGGYPHSKDEFIHTKPIAKGMRQLIDIVRLTLA